MKISNTKFKGTSIELHFIELISKKKKFLKGSNFAINKATRFCHGSSLYQLLAFDRSEFLTLR